MSDRDTSPGAEPPAASILSGTEYARLWAAARRRLERNGLTLATGPVQLEDLSDTEIGAICGLLGRRRPSNDRLRVRLEEVDAVLRRAGFGDGLVEVLEVLGGPLTDRRAARLRADEVRARLDAVANAHPATSDPRVGDWVRTLHQRGRITRLGVDDPAALLGDTLDVVEALRARRDPQAATGTSPGPRAVPLSVFAAGLLGDAHQLDADRPLGTLVADALRTLAGTDDARLAWGQFGVQLDQVNSSALAFMLPGEPSSIASAAAAAGQPLRVTHRMIETGFGLDPAAIEAVWLVENPSIVTLAADRLGTGCPPLIGLDGMPAGIVAALVDQVRSAGATVHVHTDLDYGGIAIATHVQARFDARPWRMDAEDYLAAIDGPTLALDRTIPPTPWSPGLADAMNRHRRAVHEEANFPTLLADLASHRA